MVSFVDNPVDALIALKKLAFNFLVVERRSAIFVAVSNDYQILATGNTEIFDRVVITVFTCARISFRPFELAFDNVYCSIVEFTDFEVIELKVKSLKIVYICKLHVSHTIVNHHFIQRVLAENLSNFAWFNISRNRFDGDYFGAHENILNVIDYCKNELTSPLLHRSVYILLKKY